MFIYNLDTIMAQNQDKNRTETINNKFFYMLFMLLFKDYN